MTYETENQMPQIVKSWTTKKGQQLALVQVIHSSDLVDPKADCAGVLITRVPSKIGPKDHYHREFCFNCGERVIVNRAILGVATRFFRSIK